MDMLASDVTVSHTPVLVDSASRRVRTKRSNAARLFGYDFFISFALGPAPRGTHSYASDLARRLRERDFTVFFSEEEARPGEHLDSALRYALKKSKALVVIANDATLKEPRWVRKEVEEFRKQNPNRPVIPIFTGPVLQDHTLAVQTEEWLMFRDKIWLDESEEAVRNGIATETLVNRLVLVPARAKSNAWWRWSLRGVMAILLALTGIAAGFAWKANLETERAVKGEELAKKNEQTANANEQEAKKQEAVAKNNLQEAKKQEGIAKAKAEEARQQRDEAIAQRRNAESRQYAARSLLAVESNSADALRLAIRAGELGDNPDSESALRHAIQTSHLEAVLAHQGGTTDADIASTHVVSVGNDGQIRLWNSETGQPLAAITAESSGVAPGGRLRLAKTSDGTRVAVWDGSNRVSVWDLRSNRELSRFKAETGRVRHVGFSPNGRDVLSVHGGSVTIRGAEDGRGLRRAGETKLSHATLSPDGKLLAIATDDGWSVMIYDMAGADAVHLSTLSTQAPTWRVHMSPDGAWLAALTKGRPPSFVLLNVSDPKNPVQYDRLHLDADVRVESMVFFPRSLRLAMGCSDGVVRVWAANRDGKWELVNALRGHTGPITDVAVSQAENTIASAGTDGTARVWSTAGFARSVAWGHRGPVSKVRLSDDGRRMVTVGGNDGTAMLWDTERNRELGVVGPFIVGVGIPSVGEVKNIILDTHGTKVAVLAGSTVRAFSRVNRELMNIVLRDSFPIDWHDGIHLSPEGRFLLVSGHPTAIYDVVTGERRIVFGGFLDAFSSAEYDRSGSRIVTVGNDKTLRVWDAASGKQVVSVAADDKAAELAIFSPDGKHVVSTGWKQPARVWSADGRFIAALDKTESSRAVFNKDGTQLWTVGWSRARAWNANNWRLHAEISSSSPGSYIVGLGQDWVVFSDPRGAVQLIGPNKPTVTLLGHKARVTAAAVSPDLSRVVTGDESGKVIVWRTSSGKIASEIYDHTDKVTTIAFSSNGRVFATGSDKKDGTVRLYALAVSDLLQFARSRLPPGRLAGAQ
jgi:WD40 repeat protein